MRYYINQQYLVLTLNLYNQEYYYYNDNRFDKYLVGLECNYYILHFDFVAVEDYNDVDYVVVHIVNFDPSMAF